MRLGWRQFNRKNISEADAYLFSELQKGDIAIDCGANVGKVTKLMAETGAKVHAFEPDPNAFRVLSETCAKLSSVTLHPCAVSKTEGNMNLYFREEQPLDPITYSVGSTLLASKTDVDASHHVSVPVVSLSKFIKGFERIRLLKIDIEGAECDVLEDLLEKKLVQKIDLLLVETHEAWIPETIPRLDQIKKQLKAGRHRHVFLNWI